MCCIDHNFPKWYENIRNLVSCPQKYLNKQFSPLFTHDFYLVEIRRERGDAGQAIGESPSMAQMQNKHNRDQQYLAVRVGRGQQPLAVEDTYKAESADYIEDICPYATFQLSKPAYSESSYSGNVYSGPYHSVRGSFVYHDVKPPPIDKFKLGHVSFFSF